MFGVCLKMEYGHRIWIATKVKKHMGKLCGFECFSIHKRYALENPFIPSGNQRWPWNILHIFLEDFLEDFPFNTLYRGCSIAMFSCPMKLITRKLRYSIFHGEKRGFHEKMVGVLCCVKVSKSESLKHPLTTNRKGLVQFGSRCFWRTE